MAMPTGFESCCNRLGLFVANTLMTFAVVQITDNPHPAWPLWKNEDMSVGTMSTFLQSSVLPDGSLAWTIASDVQMTTITYQSAHTLPGMLQCPSSTVNWFAATPRPGQPGTYDALPTSLSVRCMDPPCEHYGFNAVFNVQRAKSTIVTCLVAVPFYVIVLVAFAYMCVRGRSANKGSIDRTMWFCAPLSTRDTPKLIMAHTILLFIFGVGMTATYIVAAFNQPSCKPVGGVVTDELHDICLQCLGWADTPLYLSVSPRILLINGLLLGGAVGSFASGVRLCCLKKQSQLELSGMPAAQLWAFALVCGVGFFISGLFFLIPVAIHGCVWWRKQKKSALATTSTTPSSLSPTETIVRNSIPDSSTDAIQLIG